VPVEIPLDPDVQVVVVVVAGSSPVADKGATTGGFLLVQTPLKG
jgi:hypothetical protein